MYIYIYIYTSTGTKSEVAQFQACSFQQSCSIRRQGRHNPTTSCKESGRLINTIQISSSFKKNQMIERERVWFFLVHQSSRKKRSNHLEELKTRKHHQLAYERIQLFLSIDYCKLKLTNETTQIDLKTRANRSGYMMMMMMMMMMIQQQTDSQYQKTKNTDSRDRKLTGGGKCTCEQNSC